MKNLTDKYLEQAKNSFNAKTLVGTDTTREIIARSDGGIIKSKYKNLLKPKGTIKMITYSSILGLAIIALFLLFPAKHSIQNNKTNLANKYEVAQKTTGSSESNESSPEAVNKEPKFSIQFSTFEAPKVDIPVIIVQGDELSGIGIRKGKQTFEFTLEGIYDLKKDDWLIDKLEPKKYPMEGIYREKNIVSLPNGDITTVLISSDILQPGNWDMKKNSGTCPIMTKSVTISQNGAATSSNSRGPNNTLINTKYILELNREITAFDSLLKINLKTFNFENLNSPAILSVDQSRFRIISKLLPIISVISNSKYINLTILWFVPTQQLINKLPENYRNFVLRQIKPLEYLDCVDCPSDYEIKKKEVEKIVPPIAGIKSIELSQEELKKIGIYYEDGKWTGLVQDSIDINKELQKFPELASRVKAKLIEMGYDSNFMGGIMRMKVAANLNSVEQSDDLKYNGWDLKKPSLTLPLGVTFNSVEYTYNKFSCQFNPNNSSGTTFPNVINMNGMRTSDFFTFTDDGIKAKIDRVIPVHILMGVKDSKDSSKIKYGDINFWFYVNKEFAELLPDRYKIPLLKELQLISDMESGKIHPGDACDSLKGERSFFGICDNASQNINILSVFPNPLSGNTLNIKFNTTEKTDISIDIYDFSGKYIFNLTKIPDCSPDEYSMKISFDEKLNDGMYLLNISDSKGNRAIQKIMVKR